MNKRQQAMQAGILQEAFTEDVSFSIVRFLNTAKKAGYDKKEVKKLLETMFKTSTNEVLKNPKKYMRGGH